MMEFRSTDEKLNTLEEKVAVLELNLMNSGGLNNVSIQQSGVFFDSQLQNGNFFGNGKQTSTTPENFIEFKAKVLKKVTSLKTKMEKSM
jgi:hypothetical protein